MKKKTVFLPVKCVALLCCFALSTFNAVFGQDDYEETQISLPAFSDEEIKSRLATMQGCLPLTFTPAVRSYVTTYCHKRPEKTQEMLGKRLMYFDLFEQKLKEHGLPEDLKYLAIVESALNPIAVSRSGARGLWQFMPATGKDYGLAITSNFDERSDPVKSTDAACRYLKRLHQRYDDWALALAAYNSGPGNVNKAIKRGHSKNFWKIQAYLPRETRSYVPGFIAASYLCKYFRQHGITPMYPELDLQMTAYIKVFEDLAFEEISSMTGLPLETIDALNPSYKNSMVTANYSGSYVILPFRVMNLFVNALNKRGNRQYSVDFENRVFAAANGDQVGDYTSSSYYIASSDHINKVAASLSCHPEHIRAWNNEFEGNTIAAGTFINVWRPVLATMFTDLSLGAPRPARKSKETSKLSTPVEKKERIAAPIPALDPHSTEGLSDALKTTVSTEKPEVFLYHTIRRRESLMDISKKYEVSVEELKHLNPDVKIKAGNRIKIQRQ